MPVTCPICGVHSPQPGPCDICGTDAAALRLAPSPPECPVEGETPLRLGEGQRARLGSPLAHELVRLGDRAWRVHWLAAGAWRYWRPHVLHRQSCACPALPPARVVEQDGGAWVAVEAGAGGLTPWADPRPADPLEQVSLLADFLTRLTAAVGELHQQGLLWLTYPPEHLEAAPGPAGLRFTNLDLRVYPSGRCPDHLPVLTGYTAPEIWRFEADRLTPRTDVFHLAVFAYYWAGGLLPGGFPGRGLPASQFELPPLRVLNPGLPPGVAGVLARGLAFIPEQRQATPADLAGELRDALARARRRARAVTPLAWEVGWCTTAGAAKEACGHANEDSILVREYDGPPRTLVAVADGISVCDVGSGALASQTACRTLDGSFGDLDRAADFPAKLAAACRLASETLLAWALERGHGPLLREGKHLMGTTLAAGWIEGNTLQVGNLGDSRVYLVEGGRVDQLTVDGDVGSALIALRVPPEEVRGAGGVARALRECVGGCVCDDEGRPAVSEEHCRPTFSSWALLPGDVLVFCTDGLVEEGVFLDPHELGDIVTKHLHRNAEELAVRLTEAADARQRRPSALEPEGFGDNISVVVVKLREASEK